MRVFISYMREQDAYGAVSKLRARLEVELRIRNRSTEVFLDTRNLQPGDHFPQELASRLEEADVLVVLLSSGWLQSEWCRRELSLFTQDFAHATKLLRVIPVLWEHTPELQAPREPIAAYLATVNFDDWREIRHEEPSSPMYSKRTARLADAVVVHAAVAPGISTAGEIAATSTAGQEPPRETEANAPDPCEPPRTAIGSSAKPQLEDHHFSYQNDSAADVHPASELRRALFHEVPHILDTFCRWVDFRIGRLGKYRFSETVEYVPRPAWQGVAFFFYAALCLLAVFGPTWNPICATQGIGVSLDYQSIGALLSFVAAPLVFLFILNRLTSHVARRAESLAATEPQDWRASAGQTDESLQRTETVAGAATTLLRLVTRASIGNLQRFFVAMPRLPLKDKMALLILFNVLVFVALLLATPIVMVGLGLSNGHGNPSLCMLTADSSLIGAQFMALGALVVGGALIWRQFGGRRSLLTFVALLLLLGAFVIALWLWFTPLHPSEAAGGFYPHIFLFAIAALFVVALAARFFARVIFSKVKGSQSFREALASEDLLRSEQSMPELSAIRLWSAVVGGVTSNQLHFLLLPSIAGLLAPGPLVAEVMVLFAGVSVLLLTYCTVSSQRAQMLIVVDRWFLTGTPLIFSVVIIFAAILRLFDTPFISIVIDGLSVGVLLNLIVFTYAALWFFEYWVNRWAGEKLLEVLGEENSARRGFIPWSFNEHLPSWASGEGRVIALHGIGRFVAQGWFERTYPTRGESRFDQAFTTYGLGELFETLGARHRRGISHADDVRRRIQLYFASVNFLLTLAVLAIFSWHQGWSRPLAMKPMIHATAARSHEPRDFARPDRLARSLMAQTEAGRPAIIVAASGDGTRAALYSALALEGIARLDRARDVVLMSGTSGGSIAAAVFASRFEQLRSVGPDAPSSELEDPWRSYIAAVSSPFIQDVLEGSVELRFAGATSLGTLLQESLDRRAFQGGVNKFAHIEEPALILNTTISGHAATEVGLAYSCTKSTTPPSTQFAGAQLIFTNLRTLDGFPSYVGTTYMPDWGQKFRIVTDGEVSLSSAAALSATFMPLFSDARVRIHQPEVECSPSLFVNGGEATNSGLVSALYALRGTLGEIPADIGLSDIHLLALAAPSDDFYYRGFSGSSGVSEQNINSTLTQSLLQEVGALVERHGAALRLHYLPMPSVFRSGAGTGTDWASTQIMRVFDPHAGTAREPPGMNLRAHVDLDREEILSLWRALFDPREPFCPRRAHGARWTEDAETVAHWICGYSDESGFVRSKVDLQVDAWRNLILQIGRP